MGENFDGFELFNEGIFWEKRAKARKKKAQRGNLYLFLKENF